MADYARMSSKFPSWGEYYQANKKRLTESQLSLSNKSPSTFVDDRNAFETALNSFERENFLLLPDGGNRVKLVHNCFTADMGDPTGPSAFGILGSRSTAPLKRINVGHAVMAITTPRITRSEEAKEEGVPCFQSLTSCENADEFRDLVAEPREKGLPATLLWEWSQSCFVPATIFEAFGPSCTRRAGDLAMDIMKKELNLIPKGEPEDEDALVEHTRQILVLLWAIENARASKVSLSDPLITTSLTALPKRKVFKDIFDSRQELSKENTRNWPRFQHHSQPGNKKVFMCLKYQSTGRCSNNCYLAHVNPATMPGETKKIITERYKQVYG